MPLVAEVFNLVTTLTPALSLRGRGSQIPSLSEGEG